MAAGIMCLMFLIALPTFVFVMKWFEDSAELKICRWCNSLRLSQAVLFPSTCFKSYFSESAILF